MALPQVSPGAGGKRPRVHFAYVTTTAGKPWRAWVAGACHWFTVHPKGKTKPCLHEMTKGELTCERCDAGHGWEIAGYMPLYRESDARPVMVIVHEYTRELVDQLKLHSRVLVGRGEDKTDGVYVIPNPDQRPPYTSTLPERMRPADLTETLLRVWRLPDLVTWYEQTHGALAVNVPKGPVPKRSDGSEYSPMMRAAAARAYKAPSLPEDTELGELMDAIKDKTKDFKTGSNGHHKPKG